MKLKQVPRAEHLSLGNLACAGCATSISEDDLNNGGDLVSSLLPGSISDVDVNAQQGIAITSLTPSNGSWEYSIDGGTKARHEVQAQGEEERALWACPYPGDL